MEIAMVSMLLLGVVSTEVVAESKPWWAEPSFGLDRIGILGMPLAGRPLWQYGAMLLWVGVAFGIAALADFVMTRWLRRVVPKTRSAWDDRIVEVLHQPVKLLVFLLALRVGVGVFEWPQAVEKGLQVVFATFIAVTVVYIGMRCLDIALEAGRQRLFTGDEQLAKMMIPVLSRTLKGFVIVTGVLTTAQYLGIPITSVLAGLGVGGVAMALAAQNTLANMFGSFTILTDRPFRVGDRIQIDKYDGIVEEIGLRSTRIRTLDGHLVVIPNKTVADSAISNVSLRPYIRETFTISLSYHTTAERVQEAVRILKEIFAAHPMTQDVIVFWKSYAPSSLDIFVVYWCKTRDYREFTTAIEQINLEIKRRFDAAGLEFAFPTQTIYLRGQSA
ncbi:MAG: mechanosensitive ion channel family protein [Verrucomicrobiae bacterium]|nr:mechanosensitive ion channel family protein [Verrucomicrobiae bacterium]